MRSWFLVLAVVVPSLGWAQAPELPDITLAAVKATGNVPAVKGVLVGPQAGSLAAILSALYARVSVLQDDIRALESEGYLTGEDGRKLAQMKKDLTAAQEAIAILNGGSKKKQSVCVVAPKEVVGGIYWYLLLDGAVVSGGNMFATRNAMNKKCMEYQKEGMCECRLSH